MFDQTGQLLVLEIIDNLGGSSGEETKLRMSLKPKIEGATGVCNQFARGVFGMLGAVNPESFDTLHSYTNTFQIPFVTPWFPEKVIPPSSGLIDHAVSMRPDYHKAIVDIIVHYGWTEIIYVYDSHDGKSQCQH
ncbi:unnamed protein product [Pieris macdunnoughi]|uniref:Receptor ligand binding region domain-containing protein n=1 Tax=Pieris macdunnoughi TaxID=345717 RepID=A0A821LHS5_9NEOP|nr:unnamed protein product [Pieris macdunnoughi]